jgi:peptidoglycan/xylan/chitin deacetylase (PgdA/CDA1 family)
MRRKRTGKGPLVLLYHRVARLESDPQLLAVTPEHFAEHLDVLNDQCELLPLDRLIDRAMRSEAPENAVAITFDDGYADNLSVAKPLLDRYEAPATVFVASGYVIGGRTFWWDELERLLLGAGRLPRLLAVAIDGEKLVWNLGDDAEHGVDAEGWTVLDEDRRPRQQVYRFLQNRLRLLDESEREQALDQLRAVAGCDGEHASASARPLTTEELALLAAGGRIVIGAHTVAHPALSALPRVRQSEEIAGSKAQLETALSCSVSSFSYPYGTVADFDETAVSLVKEAGFQYACTNIPGRVGNRTDRFRIPRVLVRNLSGEALAATLSKVRD